MRLIDYAQDYATHVDASDGYRDQIRHYVRHLEAFLGRPLLISELTVEVINLFVLDMRDRKRSANTIRSQRNGLLRLANHASRNPRLQDKPPRPDREEVVVVKGVPTIPRAWTVPEIQRLLKVAGELVGRYRSRRPIEGVPLGADWITRADYWASYVRGVWDTGLRRVDMLRLRRAEIQPDGQFVLTQHKTRKVIYGRFRSETLELIDRTFGLSPERVLVWPNPNARRSTWQAMARRMIRHAGLVGGIGRLRASAGTAVELAYPLEGHRFLGNTRDVFERHYYDRTHGRADTPLPPSLDEAPEPDPVEVRFGKPGAARLRVVG